MKQIFQNGLLVFLGLAAGLVVAETVSAGFLPRPLLHRLPLLKMQADPHYGYRYRPDQEGYTLESKARINRQGFRGPDRKFEKDPGVVRIVLLGDSYIFGQGVGDDQTAAAQLEKILNAQAPAGNRYEVLNFGISGYDLGHEIKVLEHEALRFQPDIVLLNFFINDLFYIPDYGFYPRMLEKGEREFSPFKWELRNVLRRSRLGMYGWDLLKSVTAQKNEVLQTIHAYAVAKSLPSQGPRPEGWMFTLDRLKDFKRLADQNHFKAVLTVIPTPEEMQRGEPAPYSSYLLGEGAQLGMQTADVFDGFQKAGLRSWEKGMIPYDYHFNQEGNRILAEVFAQAVLHS